ncbi:hypothetical protein ACFQ36_11595 [Arthrobacter sp. GCM10027362]|uniref:hypothetical protein n=1 Tax=Arthrobacter sp. GCM10027362 TaxID=3273379 RepID=UPI00363077F6
MSSAPDPSVPALRLQQPSWKDPRLLIGILLVLASLAGVTALVSSADKTVPMLAAKEQIAVGTPLAAEDFVVVDARLGDLEGAYLRAADPMPANAVATSLLRPGELVPRSALGRADELDRKPVGLPVDSPLPDGAGPGARVDVWVALPDARNGFGEPQLLLEAAEISQLTRPSSALGGLQPEQLHVLVPDSKMAVLLHALSNGARINVVLNPGSAS